MEEQMVDEISTMDNLMEMLGELQERYGISDDEINAIIDGINVVIDEGSMEGEEPAEETWTCPECGMEVPASETVCPECGYSVE